MKRLILVGGTMGVGKTAACRALSGILPNNVFLDGDWCWQMTPFVVSEETKGMAMENISYLLGNFLRCSVIEHVIFCWVMHEQSIVGDLLSRLPEGDYRVDSFSLVCTEEALRHRLGGDVASGLRTPDVIERSVPRLALYETVHSVKIDTTELSVLQTAQRIAAMLK